MIIKTILTEMESVALTKCAIRFISSGDTMACGLMVRQIIREHLILAGYLDRDGSEKEIEAGGTYLVEDDRLRYSPEEDFKAGFTSSVDLLKNLIAIEKIEPDPISKADPISEAIPALREDEIVIPDDFSTRFPQQQRQGKNSITWDVFVHCVKTLFSSHEPWKSFSASDINEDLKLAVAQVDSPLRQLWKSGWLHRQGSHYTFTAEATKWLKDNKSSLRDRGIRITNGGKEGN